MSEFLFFLVTILVLFGTQIFALLGGSPGEAAAILFLVGPVCLRPVSLKLRRVQNRKAA